MLVKIPTTYLSVYCKTTVSIGGNMWETGPLTQPEMYLGPVTELVRTS